MLTFSDMDGMDLVCPPTTQPSPYDHKLLCPSSDHTTLSLWTRPIGGIGGLHFHPLHQGRVQAVEVPGVLQCVMPSPEAVQAPLHSYCSRSPHCKWGCSCSMYTPPLARGTTESLYNRCRYVVRMLVDSASPHHNLPVDVHTAVSPSWLWDVHW